MKKRRNRRYTWYVEPLNPTTNGIIASALPGEDALPDIKCADGTARNLWRCRRSYVALLLAAQGEIRIAFRIFRREGVYGKIIEWTFERKPRHRVLAVHFAA